MSQLGLRAELPIGGSTLPDCGSFVLSQLWNPLDFLDEEEQGGTLDLQEMEELGSLTRQKLDEYGIDHRTRLYGAVYGSEVGDDRVDASVDPVPLAASLVVQEKIIGMVTSEEDTVLSKRLWNFCEVSSFIPCDKSQSFDYARRNNEFRNLGFNDSIVLRIIMDVSKGDMSHSSTPVGKMTLLGAKMRSPRAEFRLAWMLASWLQDAFLNTRLASDPKYLPSIMGGAGVPCLYDKPENLFLFVRAYRGGGYNRIYGTCTAELENCLKLIELGRPSVPHLCNRMRERQDYFWGTYAEKVFIPEPSIFGGVQENLPMPLYKATGAENRVQAFENRLLRTRHIVTRSEAVKEQIHTEQLRHTLLGSRGTTLEARAWMKDQSSIARSKYGLALNTNSALQNLLRRKATDKDVRELLGNDAFTVISSGQREFTLDHAQWICNGGKSATYSILDLTTSEDIYVREEVSAEESFKVPRIPLNPMVGDRLRTELTRAKVGLYQINSTMEEWAEDLCQRLISRREELKAPVPRDVLIQEFSKDPEWVNDDSLLIRKAISLTEGGMNISHSVLLVSKDHRLANQMAQQANVNVYRLDPLTFVQICRESEIDPQSFPIEGWDLLSSRIEVKKRDKPHVLVDTGSLASSMSRLDEDDEGNLVTRSLLECYISDEGRRVSKYSLVETNDLVKRRLGYISPIQKPRFYRNVSRGLGSNYATSSAGGSWRSGSESGKI